ncbi:aldose 1-epimerase family protein [Aquirufa sp. Wall-65K1]
MTYPWKDKISNHKQLGGIETSTLDNGAGIGVRIAWMDTGAGFRYKIVLDRGMDIAEAFYQEKSLAWISHAGITSPQPLSDQGLHWLRTFGGGLLTTCGLDHVGGPEQDEYGSRGIHGKISNQIAEITSIVQPDIHSGQLDMSISGIIRQHVIFGPCLTLKRTISGRLGEAFLKIEDEIINEGNMDAPLMLLYHFNFGWPLVDQGTKIVAEGTWKYRFEGTQDALIFKEGNDYKTCPAPLDIHLGGGEEVAFIDAATDAQHQVACGLYNEKLGLGVKMSYDKRTLPSLTNWQHWGKDEYVTGIEPGTNPPIGQKAAREEGSLVFLAPRASKRFSVTLEVLDQQKQAEKLTNFIQ